MVREKQESAICFDKVLHLVACKEHVSLAQIPLAKRHILQQHPLSRGPSTWHNSQPEPTRDWNRSSKTVPSPWPEELRRHGGFLGGLVIVGKITGQQQALLEELLGFRYQSGTCIFNAETLCRTASHGQAAPLRHSHLGHRAGNCSSSHATPSARLRHQEMARPQRRSLDGSERHHIAPQPAKPALLVAQFFLSFRGSRFFQNRHTSARQTHHKAIHVNARCKMGEWC